MTDTIVPFDPTARAHSAPLALLPASTCSDALRSWSPWRGEPLPRECTPQALASLERALAEREPGATRREIVAELELLRAHYGEWGDVPAQIAEGVWLQWFTDLAGLPLGLLREACRRWRNSAAKRPPTPGELLATIADERRALRHLREQLDRATGGNPRA